MLWLALASAGLVVARRARAAKACVVLTAALFVVFGVLPVGVWLARPLENQYPRPTLPAHVDGILTLGGGLDTPLTLARGAPAAELAETRLVSTFALARAHPEARVVFSGGSGRYPDAMAAGAAFEQMGLDPARLTLEGASRTTYENLVFSRRLVRPQPGEVWVLATSAIQMPRAMAVARQLGWTLIPWPTDYLTTPSARRFDIPDEMNVPGRFAVSDAAAHEWLGLLAYSVGGMARESPAPRPAGATNAPAVLGVGR